MGDGVRTYVIKVRHMPVRILYPYALSGCNITPSRVAPQEIILPVPAVTTVGQVFLLLKGLS